jgi:hypothetical protein
MPTRPAAARICAVAALLDGGDDDGAGVRRRAGPRRRAGRAPAERSRSVDQSVQPGVVLDVPPAGTAAGATSGRWRRAPPGAIDAGYTLADSVHRPSWWGGDELRLLDAVNTCLTGFMGGKPLEADEDAARQIYEYLVTVSPDPAAPALPVTVVRTIDDLSALKDGADADRGRDIYDRACRRCHGAPHTRRGTHRRARVVHPRGQHRGLRSDAGAFGRR